MCLSTGICGRFFGVFFLEYRGLIVLGRVLIVEGLGVVEYFR